MLRSGEPHARTTMCKARADRLLPCCNLIGCLPSAVVVICLETLVFLLNKIVTAVTMTYVDNPLRHEFDILLFEEKLEIKHVSAPGRGILS